MKKLFPLFLLPLVIVLLSLYLVYPLFMGEHTQFPGSIESQYLSHIKFIVENFPRVWWQPFWYTGFPFYLFYQPVLPFSLSLIRMISGLPISTIYRGSIAIFYALGGVSLYFLIRDWTKRSLSAFLASVVYSLGPSITAVIPVIASQEKELNLVPWRLVVLTLYGEGAHIWGLAIAPLSLIFFRRLLKKPIIINWILTVGLMATVLLTSTTVFMPLLVLLFIIWISELCLEEGGQKSIIFLLVLLFTVGISSFWYNLSFLKAIFGFAESGAGGIFHGLYQSPVVFLFIAIPALAVFLVVAGPILQKGKEVVIWFIGLTSFIVIFSTVYLGYCCRWALLPFPLGYIPRFGPEVELVFAMILGIGLATSERWLERLLGRFGLLRKGFYLLLAGLILFVGWSRVAEAHNLTAWHRDVISTSEYRVAKWLEGHHDGSRIYATGTHGQWLNFWTEVPQLRGAADQAIVNPLWPHVIYQIYWGEDGELAVNWLKAIGIKYIVVNTSQSKVAYHDFRYPEKFKGLAEPVFEYQGDIIYFLPTQKTKLVYKIESGKLEKIGRITSVLDEKRLGEYLLATENNSNFEPVDYTYERPWDSLQIQGEEIDPKEGLLVRMSYHPGWRALQGSSRLKIESDPIGFMLVHPIKSKEGVKLEFAPTLDVKIGYGISLASLLLFAGYLRKKKNEEKP